MSWGFQVALYFLQDSENAANFYTKDLIAISNQMGAMENWGLITFIDSRLLVDDEESSALAWREAAETIVHEIAHQWFGDIVHISALALLP